MKASDYIAYFLKEQGVSSVFGMTGGMVTHLLDSIHTQGEIRIVAMHHEQAAAFSAEAVGRMTGIPGVAFATSGPGATNLLTGIGSCYFDSVPAIFITGQVNRNELRKNRAIRQLGFQETDIVAMSRPITKAAWLVETPEELPSLLSQAFEIATDGRPGPVLIDIPMDVQRADISIPPTQESGMQRKEEPSDESFHHFFEALSRSRRPLILAGGGIRSAGAGESFRMLLEKLQIPVLHSLMGVDVLPSENPLRVGMIGTYGNRWANMALAESDFLCVLGSRLDIRQTGSDVETFRGERKIFHVDCEPGEINNRVKDCYGIASDLKVFLEKAVHYMKEKGIRYETDREWLEKIDHWKMSYPDTKELLPDSGINPNVFMHQLSERSASAKAFITDVGQHQMWAAQSLEIGSDQRFLTSGGMGSMGFALPAAIGAAFVSDSRPVVMIAGDGGFQCNSQELETVVRNKLPLKMVVMNNRSLGMVRQFQEDYFESRYVATMWGYSAPNFAEIVKAYGVPAISVDKASEVEAALDWLWNDPLKPALLQVMVGNDVNVYPKIAFGCPINEMEPRVS